MKVKVLVDIMKDHTEVYVRGERKLSSEDEERIGKIIKEALE